MGPGADRDGVHR